MCHASQAAAARVELASTFYVLNPGGDLADTQSCFEDWFAKQLGWQVGVHQRAIGWAYISFEDRQSPTKYWRGKGTVEIKPAMQYVSCTIPTPRRVCPECGLRHASCLLRSSHTICLCTAGMAAASSTCRSRSCAGCRGSVPRRCWWGAAAGG